ncbi:MAG TPA: SHD1 domain-containing protein [Thermoguttaceae bacterium]|nr:SHD1 domain-containing protein [Thermoguttaceae bacterium]
MKCLGNRFAWAVFLAIVWPSFLQVASPADVRTWTDATGQFTVEAELVEFRDGVVQLKRSDGRMISLPLNRLGVADQEYVGNLSAASPSSGSSDFTITTPVDAVIEFLTGSKAEGRILSKDEQYVSFNATIGGRTFLRKYPIDRIHAVTIDGNRVVLNEKTAESSSPPVRPGTGTDSNSGTTAAAGNRLSPAAIESLIGQVGSTEPDWLDSVPLNYPPTLDLSWPQPPPKGWDAQRNVGQYVWDIINRNPNKWQEGVRFMYFMLDRHKDNPTLRRRVMNEMGRMYFNLLTDYPRAAYWFRQAGVDRDNTYFGSGIHLAECYWRMGSKETATELLNKLSRISIHFSMLKLLGDMGEADTALKVLDQNTTGQFADVALLCAGDVCRVAGRHEQSIEYYQRLLALPATGQADKRILRNQQLARASIEAVKLFELVDLRRVPDGTYQASSLGYEDQVHVEVVVQGGRIMEVRVTHHQEKQYYSALIDTPRKIVEKQSVKGIDGTTGATITAKAVVAATAKALAGAMQ